MRIGVIVPVYNTAKYLRQCIHSILKQPYAKMDVILVDDGSTDGSAEICDEFGRKDERITVIHQENQGKLAARYAGVRALQCDYITFVDSDDWIDDNTFERFLPYMEKGIDVISWQIVRYHDTDWQRISTHNFPYGIYNTKKYQKEVKPFMIWNFEKDTFGIDPSLCNKLIKRDLILKSLQHAQEINVGYGDDVAVIYPLLFVASTLFLSEDTLYYHRQRSVLENAPYYIDNDFYKKLQILYDYLKVFFYKNGEYAKQIDMFYINSVIKYNRNIYKEEVKMQGCLFPFDMVPSGKNIILYGASKVGQSYYNQLKMLSYASKILWIDKNYDRYKDLGVKNPDVLPVEIAEYDYIVIAIKPKNIADYIKEQLYKVFNSAKRPEIIWKYREGFI